MNEAHPLRDIVQELALHRQCAELALPLLTETDVEMYLTQRFAVGAVREPSLPELAWVIHQRTEGNPLFMVNVVEDLLTHGELNQLPTEITTPPTIRQLIEHHFERLEPAEQEVLVTASVAGIEFSAAAVAAGGETTVEEVEHCCAALARRRQFIHIAGVSEWPDGTLASRFAFQHALYQEVLHDQVTAAQKVTLHRRIAERLEHAYGKRASEVATELAVHFERGRNYSKAVQYLQQAGQNALRCSAHQEAITLFMKGLELLKRFPPHSNARGKRLQFM